MIKLNKHYENKRALDLKNRKESALKISKYTNIFELYRAGYSVNAIAHLLKIRKDAILQKLAKEALSGKLDPVSPKKTVIEKLPKNIIEDLPYFPAQGPFLVEAKDMYIIISILKHAEID